MRRIVFIIIMTLCSLVSSCNGDNGNNSSNQDDSSIVQPKPQPNPDPMPQPQPNRPHFISHLEDKSTNVSLSSPIEIAFSEPMNLSTVNPSNVQLSIITNSNATRLPLVLVSASNDRTQFKFKPEISFTAEQKYQITLTNGVRTQTGKSVAGQFSFTTQAYAPTLVSMTNPAPDQNNVNLLPIIKLQFTQKVTNVESETLVLYEGNLNGPQIPLLIENINSDTYNLTPQTSLREYTTYLLQITSEIRNVNQAPLKRTTFKFTTGEEIQPEVALVNPANPQSASIYSKIILKFSEKITNLNTSSLKLLLNNQYEVPIQISALGSNNSYQITLLDNQQ